MRIPICQVLCEQGLIQFVLFCSASGSSALQYCQNMRICSQEAGLFTPKQLETRTFEMQSHALSIRFFSSRDSALGCIFTDNGAAKTTAEPLQALEPAKTDLCSAAEKTSGGRVNEEAATPRVQVLCHMLDLHVPVISFLSIFYARG